MKKMKIVFGILGLILWFSAMELIGYYDSHRPDHAIAETKNTIVQNTHGSIVFITPVENVLIKGLMIAAVICIAISGFAYYRTLHSK